MNTLVMLADSNSGGAVQEIARTFGVDWPHLISQIISFCIVCILLQRFAYRPVLAMLQKRRELIAETLANSEKVKAELAGAQAEKQQVLGQANVQATKLINEAHAAATVVQERETQKAIASAKNIITKANEAAVQTHARMLGDLKREVGHLVVQTTGKVTGKILSPDDQRRLELEAAEAVRS